MIVEAKDNRALSRGMNSLGRRLGKFLRRLSLGKGAIFKERFRLHEFDVFSSGYRLGACNKRFDVLQFTGATVYVED